MPATAARLLRLRDRWSRTPAWCRDAPARCSPPAAVSQTPRGGRQCGPVGDGSLLHYGDGHGRRGRWGCRSRSSVRGRVEPAAREARAFEAAPDVRIAAYHVPHEARAVILEI